jgi:hypothetical protein
VKIAGLTILIFMLAALSPTFARVATRLCVKIAADAQDRDGLHKLVLDELAHHPSHQVVDQDCQSLLSVDLFELRKKRYLTARINREVPVRYDVGDASELSEKVSQAIAQVLSHDPVYLSDDITHYSAIRRAAYSILKRGHNIWRLELFQGIGNGGDNVAFAPGAAVAVTRGADNWQVFPRIFFSGWPAAARGSETVLQVAVGADIGLTYEFSARSNFSFYVSAGLGLEYLRFEGRLNPEDPQSLDQRNDFGPTFSVRLGMRMFRIYDFDCDLFVAGYLPMFPADADTLLGRFYSPTMQAGLGVGF